MEDRTLSAHGSPVATTAAVGAREPPPPAGAASGSRGPFFAGLALAGAMAAVALVAAVQRAWVADDAYITFRHVAQFLAGNGLTYNAGERVEGFTHPLWALLLCAAGLIGVPPVPASLVLSLSAATALVALALRLDVRGGRPRVSLALALIAACTGFVDFATSGLETALAMLLVFLAFRASPPLSSPWTSGGCLALAYLCHPDLAVLALGPAVLALLEARLGLRKNMPRLGAFAAAFAVPALAWHAFRLRYYGDLLPNTYYAKAGGAYWSQGFTYVADFGLYAPLTALGLGVVAAAAIRDARRGGAPAVRWRRAVGLAAIAAHALAIASFGGDFMGLRLLLPSLAALAALAGGALPDGVLGSSKRLLLLQGGLAAACVYLVAVAPPPPRERGWIVNERLVYRGTFDGPLDAFRGEPNHLWWRKGLQLAGVQDCVGEPPLVVDFPNIGFFGYAAGTRASVIDGVGLVDRYLARNWAVRAGRNRGRPGHEGKMTLDYALRRGIHFAPTPYDSYNEVMGTRVGVLLTLDPRIVCTFPGKARRLRELKSRLSASAETWDRRTLQLIERLEERDRVRVEELCTDGPPRANCGVKLR